MKALLDCGAEDNYVSARAVFLAGLQPLRKAKPFSISLANGEEMPGQEQITHEVTTVMEMQGHTERITLDFFGLAIHDVILGLPWLRKHNPRIDWATNKLSFDCCGGRPHRMPPRGQSSKGDERAMNQITSERPNTQPKDWWGIQEYMQYEKEIPTEKNAPPAIPTEYQNWHELFEDVEPENELPQHQPWDHEITLQEGKTPTFGPIYGLSEKELAEVRSYIKERLAKGHIRESKSPAGYPILFVPKKNGKLRMCVDYRKLNDITIKNRYPLPNISELQDRLSHAKIFTALDLRDGYHLVRIKAGDEWKTAFRTRYGHYEYTVMPFGLTNAPATFQALINNVLREHLDIFVIAYLDDILIYSENEEEHVKHVQTVLDCFRKAKLRLRPEKCEFHKEEVDFLGFTVNTTGVKMSKDKIEVVQNWPRPTNVKGIQEFLGFCNFNRRFIKDYSRITIPLTKLTRKDVPFTWENEQENAFQQLKEACINPPTLISFRSGEPLRMETDASDLALGACITQEREGKWHPIAYYSRKFTPAEERYDVHDKELMAIVDSVRHWRIYIESCTEPTVYTDHKNLTYFTTSKVLNRRQVRWAETLSQYKLKIVYTPGKDNGRADALSRRSDLAGEKTTVDTAILKINKDGTLEPAHQLNHILRITNEVPEELQEAIIRQHHDDPVHGHQGITRTMELIRRNYEFKHMKNKVTKYIKKCSDCQKNKHTTHAMYGELQPIPLPEAPWTDIAMDFVTGLPDSKDPVTGYKYNAICNIVCRFSKAAEFIPFRRDYTAEQLGYVVHDRLIRYHGIPKSIISDRDKLFTSNYWTTLCAAIGIKRKLSTAYHPETDGQTERINQTMETYLRIYSNKEQDNWVKLLPMAQLAYNNKKSETTGLSPFFTNHGRHPNLFEQTYPTTIKSDKATMTAEELKAVHQRVQENILSAQRKTISHVNKKRKMAPQLKEGDRVYLLTKNLRTRRPSKKLDHVKVGPFLIEACRGPVNYKLRLPDDAKIHPVFHIKYLEPADPETPLQTTFYYETEEEDEFEVEKILAKRGTEYLVKWLGYPDSENTWEPRTNLSNCQEKLKQFENTRHRR
jgi:transposase InsO family protein